MVLRIHRMALRAVLMKFVNRVQKIRIKFVINCISVAVANLDLIKSLNELGETLIDETKKLIAGNSTNNATDEANDGTNDINNETNNTNDETGNANDESNGANNSTVDV